MGGGGVIADTVAGKDGCGPEKPRPPVGPAVPSSAVGGTGTAATPWLHPAAITAPAQAKTSDPPIVDFLMKTPMARTAEIRSQSFDAAFANRAG
jgi:hypothetical protein